jgi:hypothetical protein
MSRRKKIFRVPTPSGLEDAWLRMATTNAIAAARKTIDAGVLPPNTAVGRLSDVEWGWIVASVIFGWIATRAAQATSNGLNGQSVDKYIQQTGLEPDPWLAGAVACVLHELGRTKVDWNASLGTLSQEEIVAFLTDAYVLINAAIRAREAGEHGVTKVSPPGEHPVVPWDDPIPAFDREVNVSS